ncbi:MAG: tyrosine--tRNA ligase [Chloroflexi bacterium]|nr:tyrosine--tRNA ligase [Chloroflexota bacterium]
MKFTEELSWRNLIFDKTPGVDDFFSNENVTGYVGFDPTSKSLHVGNLLPIMNLVRLQKYGHTPIALVGGGTGLIGDPSGKSEERKVLTDLEIEENLFSIENQLKKFLDFDSNLSNKALILNNAKWLKKISLIDFLRDVGKHFTVNYMMKKESVKSRVSRDTGISFTEFSYMTLQAYDFLHLYENFDCKLQMGGSDQMGNILAGVDLINRKNPGPKSYLAHGIVSPLITSSSGEKFGKTAGEAPTLDPNKTSAYKLYQFFINTPDEDVINYLKYFSNLNSSEIEDLENETINDPKKRVAQNKLAENLVEIVHGNNGLSDAKKITEYFFNEKYNDLTEQNIIDLSESFPSFEISKKALKEDLKLGKFLVDNNVFNSMSEMKRMSDQGALYINGNRINDAGTSLTQDLFIRNNFMVIRVGSKKYHLSVLK